VFYVVKKQKVIGIAAGYHHSMLLVENHPYVVCFGWNDYGQCNVPTDIDTGVLLIDAGGLHSLVLCTDRRLRAFGHNNSGQCNIPDDVQHDVLTMCGGYNHTVCITMDGKLHAFGDNSNGQCTIPSALLNTPVTQIAAGWQHTVAVTDNGELVVFGDPDYCNIPTEIQDKQIVKISAGLSHTVVVCQNGSLIAFGNNESNQCTVPDTKALTASPTSTEFIFATSTANNANGSATMNTQTQFTPSTDEEELPTTLPPGFGPD